MANHIPSSVSSLKIYGAVQDFYRLSNATDLQTCIPGLFVSINKTRKIATAGSRSTANLNRVAWLFHGKKRLAVLIRGYQIDSLSTD